MGIYGKVKIKNTKEDDQIEIFPNTGNPVIQPLYRVVADLDTEQRQHFTRPFITKEHGCGKNQGI